LKPNGRWKVGRRLVAADGVGGSAAPFNCSDRHNLPDITGLAGAIFVIKLGLKANENILFLML